MYQVYSKVKEVLKKKNIEPILYGSLGVSVYLGNFKQFEDIDLLIEDEWLDAKWTELISLMNKNGFELTDEKEHEFENKDVKIAFAKKSILERDNICNPKKDLVTIEKENIAIKTLSLNAFVKAYEFSSKDGYRINQRQKKDHEILEKLKLLTK